MKSEPDAFGINDLYNKPNQTEHWDGVRNYEARNMMRDAMKLGDQVFFYHSNCEQPGIVGIMEVVKEGYPDFCIGTTEQTPKELVDLVQDFLIDYDVKINYPYCGSMIPDKFVGNPDVFPIMIEVNKKLYINNEDDFNNIKIVINQLLDVIAKYEDSF